VGGREMRNVRPILVISMEENDYVENQTFGSYSLGTGVLFRRQVA
jgi:hypothetical protein